MRCFLGPFGEVAGWGELAELGGVKRELYIDGTKRLILMIFVLL